MPTPTFSTQDAQNLIAVAQNAPLRNLKEAEMVSQLIQRFAAWHEHVTKTPADKTTRKGRQETPAGQPQDPAS